MLNMESRIADSSPATASAAHSSLVANRTGRCSLTLNTIYIPWHSYPRSVRWLVPKQNRRCHKAEAWASARADPEVRMTCRSQSALCVAQSALVPNGGQRAMQRMGTKATTPKGCIKAPLSEAIRPQSEPSQGGVSAERVPTPCRAIAYYLSILCSQGPTLCRCLNASHNHT